MDVTEKLSELLYDANPTINVDKALLEAKSLISQGADVNDEISFDDFSLSSLALVCRNFSTEFDKLREFNIKVAEELVLAGAKINEHCYYWYDNSIKDDYDLEDYTPLDYLILEGGQYGLNQDTYRLAKIMITSLSKKEMKDYLKKFRHPDTFHGLVNIFKQFGLYDEHIEYMF